MAAKRKQKKTGDLSSALTAVSVTLAAFVISVIALISVELAILLAGFTAVSAFIMLDSNRRRRWEKSTSIHIRAMNDNHAKLARDVTQNSEDIATLKEEVVQTSRSVKWEDIKKQSEGPRAVKASIEEVKEAPAEESYYSKPEGLEAAVQSTIANDERFSNEPSLSDMVVKELLHHAVKDKRIDVFVQPIVRLPQRKTRFYEVYARIRAKAGIYLPAERYMELAKQDDLVNNIDNLLLTHCLQIIRKTAHIKRAAPFFLNITPGTLKNTVFMKALLSFLSRNREMASRLVFEIRHEDFEKLSAPVLQILDGIGQLGCAFSLDHVQQKQFDISFLQKHKIRFLKLDARWMLREMATDRQFADMRKMKRQLEANGIGVIAEKVETEGQLKELLDYDIHFGQGFLFGKPDLQGAYRRKKAA